MFDFATDFDVLNFKGKCHVRASEKSIPYSLFSNIPRDYIERIMKVEDMLSEA